MEDFTAVFEVDYRLFAVVEDLVRVVGSTLGDFLLIDFVSIVLDSRTSSPDVF